MERSFKTPKLVRMAQALFFLNTGIWAIFGASSLLRLGGADLLPPVTGAIIAFLMFGNAGIMAWSGVGIGRRQTGFYYTLGLAVVLVNIALTVTDEFGTFDLAVLAVDAILLGLLIAMRMPRPVQK